jgi:hypothetical protein
LDDTDALSAFLGYSILQTTGTVLRFRLQDLPGIDQLPSFVLKDDAVMLESSIMEMEAQYSKETVASVLAYILQYVGRLGKHAILRAILLYEAFNLNCLEVRGTLIDCVRQGDLQGLLIFMECSVNVEYLVKDSELYNASLVGSAILKHLMLILTRRKARGLVEVAEDEVKDVTTHEGGPGNLQSSDELHVVASQTTLIHSTYWPTTGTDSVRC